MKLPIGTGRLLWLGLTMILFASMAMGQEKTGSLQGTASDDTDAVLPGVTVTLTNKATHRITRETTGLRRLHRRDVAPGQYSVEFTLPGLRVPRSQFEILVAQNRDWTFG
jgi:hypothetical protein